MRRKKFDEDSKSEGGPAEYDQSADKGSAELINVENSLSSRKKVRKSSKKSKNRIILIFLWS